MLITSFSVSAVEILESKELRGRSKGFLEAIKTKMYNSIEQEQLKNGKPRFSGQKRIELKDKIDEYVTFISEKISDSPVAFEDFSKDPLKYYDENLKNYHISIATNPSNSFLHCVKTALKEIVCPEGAYIFSGSRVDPSVNDDLEKSLTKPEIRKEKIDNNSSSSNQ